MRTFLTATAVLALGAGGATAGEDIRLGISLGFTGALESTAPDAAKGAELAMKEVTDSGLLLDGATVGSVHSDSTCTDASAAVTAAGNLVSAGVKGIVGGMCSGETIATLEQVARPNGIVMISPSASSPALTTIEDDGLFFRTHPSDSREGRVMAEIVRERGLETVAVTYTNNDFGKGLADSFQHAFEELGGTVTISAAHEDGKADYSAEVAALDAAGGEALIVAGYVDQGGSGVVRAALDAGAFDIFVFGSSMVTQSLIDRFGTELEHSFGENPSSEGAGRDGFVALASAAGFDGSAPFSAESYDAAALMLLAMQAAGSSDPEVYKASILDVANAPGEQILPGELAKGLQLLKDGQDIDYVGATAVEMNEAGDPGGSYREVDFPDGQLNVVGYR